MLSLFKNDLKQLKNLAIIYYGCLLLNFIIGAISFRQDFTTITFYIIVLVFTLLMPLFNLSYLFNSTKQTHYSSLPFTKMQSFMIHYLSGISCLLMPAVLYCLLDGIFLQALISSNCIALFIMILLYYSLSSLTAYLTTSIIMDIVLEVLIIIIPPILYLSLYVVYGAFVKGIIAGNISLEVINLIMPLYNLIIGGCQGLNVFYILLYLGYIIVIFALALLVCKKRSCSINYSGFAYKIAPALLKLVVIICSSWMLTAILGTGDASVRTFIITNIIATVIVTFIIQFIQFRKIKYQLCIIQAFVIVLTTASIFYSSKEYLENYIPNKIDAVMIEDNTNDMNSKIKITDQNSIEKVVSIHQRLIKHKIPDDRLKQIKITYIKPNQDEVIRAYYVDKQMFKELTNQFDQEMIKSYNGKYYQLLEEIDKTERIEYFYKESNYTLISKANKDLFKEILKNKLTAFENDITLLQQVDDVNSDNLYLYLDNNNLNSNWYVYSYNDPLALTIEEFAKIKAN